jgi:uncharacterized protein (TIGR02611 family)
MTTPPKRRHPLIERLAERRERHRQRPKAVRILVVLVGVTIVAGGLAMVVLPGPAVAVIPLGLALLALEFQWAETMLERAVDQADKAGRAAKEASTTQRVLTGVAIALAVGAVVTWAVIGDIPLLPV